MKYYTVNASEERKFWETWKYFSGAKDTDQVVRSGYGIYGIYDFEHAREEAQSGARGESDAEHSYGVAMLVDGIWAWFPEVFPEYLRRGGAECAWGYCSMMRLALLHDVGEVEIGDLPADGSGDKEDKNQREYEAMTRFALHLPVDTAHAFLADFRVFAADEADVGAGVRVVKLADKFDSLLELVRREERGLAGNAAIKREKYGGLTDLERELLEITGSESPTDLWSLNVFREYSQFPEFRIFLGVLTAALVDVFDEVFPWYEQEIRETYGINVERLRRIAYGEE